MDDEADSLVAPEMTRAHAPQPCRSRAISTTSENQIELERFNNDLDGTRKTIGSKLLNTQHLAESNGLSY